MGSPKKKIKKAYGSAATVITVLLIALTLYEFLPSPYRQKAVAPLMILSLLGVIYSFFRVQTGVRCPACDKSIHRQRARQDRKIWPFCMHCGAHNFPDLRPLKFDEPKEASFTFIALIAIIGGSTAYFSHELEMPGLKWAGIIVAVSSVFIAGAMNASTRNACKACHHLKGRYKYCENCGTKATTP